MHRIPNGAGDRPCAQKQAGLCHRPLASAMRWSAWDWTADRICGFLIIQQYPHSSLKIIFSKHSASLCDQPQAAAWHQHKLNEGGGRSIGPGTYGGMASATFANEECPILHAMRPALGDNVLWSMIVAEKGVCQGDWAWLMCAADSEIIWLHYDAGLTVCVNDCNSHRCETMVQA